MVRISKVMRRTGRALLNAQRQASRLNEGLDEILGPNRTRPSDGFSTDRTRKRASMGRRKDRMRSKLRDTSSGTRKDFDLSFGKTQGSKKEEKKDRRFF